MIKKHLTIFPVLDRPLTYLYSLTTVFNISAILAMQHSCRHHYMIKLIKITIKYIKWAKTTDRHSLLIRIPLLQEGDDDIAIHTPIDWLALSKCIASLLITRIWKLISQNLRVIQTNRFQISGMLKYYITKGVTCNIHAQSDAQKHCFFLFTLVLP